MTEGTGVVCVLVRWKDESLPGGYGFVGAQRPYTFRLTPELIAFCATWHGRDYQEQSRRSAQERAEGAGNVGWGWLGNKMAERRDRIERQHARLARIACGQCPEVRRVGSQAEALALVAYLEALAPIAVTLDVPDEIRHESFTWAT